MQQHRSNALRYRGAGAGAGAGAGVESKRACMHAWAEETGKLKRDAYTIGGAPYRDREGG
jgi:hypothetical protein